MNKPHIVFDFDGTLVDSLLQAVSAYNQAAKYVRTEKILEHEIQILRRLTLRELMMRLSVPKWKVPFLLVLGRLFFRRKIHEIKLFEGIEEILNALANEGYVLHVLSSNSKHNLNTFFNEHTNVKHLFSDMHSVNNLFGKGRAIKKLMKSLPKNNSQMIYVGDEVRDIDASNFANVPIISVTWGFNHERLLRQHNEFISETPTDIVKIIKNGSILKSKR